VAQTTACTNCQNPVLVRRPSASGHHYCKAPACQAAKQRFYRGRKERIEQDTFRHEALEYLEAALRGSRTTCPSCGLEDALVGWIHRDETMYGPCYGLGHRGREINAPFFDVVHPERVPVAAPAEQA
jgi:hypothetical protein